MESSAFTKFRPPARAVYVTAEQLQGNNPPALSEVSGVANVVLVDAYKEGFTYFPSAVRENYGLSPLAPRLDPYAWEDLVAEALDQGFAIAARLELLSAGNTHAPFCRSPFLRRHRNWLVTSAQKRLLAAADERGTVWLAPWNREVRDYLGALVADLCQAYPVDAIICDGWQLPGAFEAEIPTPTLEDSVDLPSQGALRDKSELEKELRERPYAAVFTTSYEESLARLIRAVRARARRGTRMPLTLVTSDTVMWPRTLRLLKEGLVEGLLINHLTASEVGSDTLLETPALVWFDEAITPQPLSCESAGTRSDFQLLASGTVVSLDELVNHKALLKESDAGGRSSEQLPELSLACCWETITDHLRYLATLPTLTTSPIFSDWAQRILKISAPTRSHASELEKSLGELTRICKAAVADDTTTAYLLGRVRNYLHLIINYYLNA
ncbi:MAG: family 10 glycosylhydrolase [Candidatus Sumerlaeaceae bacterium]|nr:family 10 glycosylhydrolase [Candidatus Sumerlaeaceae bacterium]